jgi:predicted outer membrane lipoprotein
VEESFPPAGWYEDPKDATRRRYWDGAHWAALTQPPTIVQLPERTLEPVGSPGNPIGVSGVELAAAFASMTATAYDAPEEVQVDPEPTEAPTRRRHLWPFRQAG